MQAPQVSPTDLARQARTAFLRHVTEALPALVERLQAHLLELLEQPSTVAQGQERRDFYLQFQQQAPVWLRATTDALQALAVPLPAQPSAPAPLSDELSLVGEDTVEVQILAARAALSAMDKGSGDFNDLRLRLQHLEGSRELVKGDPVHALNVAQAVVDAWLLAGFPREQWLRCQSTIQPLLAQAIADGYRVASRFLLDHGVLPEIDLRGLVRRSPVLAGAVPGAVAAPPSEEAADAVAPSGVADAPLVMVPAGAAMAMAPPAMPQSSVMAPASLVNWLSQRVPRMGQWLQQAGPAAVAMPAQAAGAGMVAVDPGMPLPPGMVLVPMPADAMGQAPAQGQGAGIAYPAGDGSMVATTGMASAVVQLMANLPPIDWTTLSAGREGLQAQTRALKAQVDSDEEKAIVEVVALIFDSILSEDRIPPSIRVWFARLQMPVLRHAMTDPGFLADEQHPARRLIDRMGACVMGFDASVSLEPLQQEIKRIVQVIEQYPDTGRRVFELTYQEFQDFLARHLQEAPSVQRIADVAQQAEQKEALTVQYTIELRQLLARAPVPDAVRQFLFQTWAEAMAMAAVTHGVADPRAKAMRQAAADLVWAMGAKASRQERAQVIARVPAILQQLRQGLALLGLEEASQESLLKPLNEALAEAFMARTGHIDPVWLQGLTESLDQVEGYLEDMDGPLSFDRDMLEMITGTDATNITTLMDTGAPLPPEALLQAELLEPGAWFHLVHDGQDTTVQLAWESAARQLYLFVSASQHAFLLQQGRVAQYLQAQLLLPVQREGLVQQASRRAVQVLEAQPERLLA